MRLDFGILLAAAVLTAVMVSWAQTVGVIRAIVLAMGLLDRAVVALCSALNPHATARAMNERADRSEERLRQARENDEEISRKGIRK